MFFDLHSSAIFLPTASAAACSAHAAWSVWVGTEALMLMLASKPFMGRAWRGEEVVGSADPSLTQPRCIEVCTRSGCQTSICREHAWPPTTVLVFSKAALTSFIMVLAATRVWPVVSSITCRHCHVP